MRWESVLLLQILLHVLKPHGQIAVYGKFNCHEVVETRLALFLSIELQSIKLVSPLGLSQLE